MPKRKGYRWEQIVTRENCREAVREVLRNRHRPAIGSKLHTPNRRDIQAIIRERAGRKPRYGVIETCEDHVDEVAESVYLDLLNGTWTPRPYRTKSIYDKLRKKRRQLKMPCLYDQFVHHAVLRVMIPDLQKRFDYGSCGSVPGAGQKRAAALLKKRLAKPGRRCPKYAASTDIFHFYENCGAESVMKCLRRVYKDPKLLALNEKILKSMGGTLAIGFFPSPWYANLVLDMLTDKPLKETFGKEISLVRYADDMALTGRSKRTLHRAVQFVQERLRAEGMRLKDNFRVYRTGEGVPFLSYRFFPRCTLIRKPILYRITRAAKKVKGGISPDLARRLCSYKGIMLPANSYTVYKKYFRKNTWQKCRRVIRYVDKLCNEAGAGVRHAAPGQAAICGA